MIALALTILLSFGSISATADEDWQVADVGFANSDYYIHTQFEAPLAEIVFEFFLCNTKSQRCAPLNQCRYSETELRSKLNTVSDPRIRDDLDQFFYRDLYASVGFDEFYNSFTKLLREVDKSRATPECALESIRSLKDSVTNSAT